MPTPADLVLQHYKFPFSLHEYQKEVVNETADFDRTAHFLDIGVGKSCTSTVWALYKGLQYEVDQIMVLVPPILLRQWGDWLASLGLSVTIYAGSPAKRKTLDLSADAVVLSYQILKNDFAVLTEYFKDTKLAVIVDECAAVRNPGTLAFKSVRDLTMLPNKHCCLLSGTPINRPHHCYGPIKIKTPDVYRSYRQFETIHITSVGQFGQPRSFANLDLLADSLMLQAVRIRAEDVLELPEVIYQPVVYDLAPKHKKLYDRLVEQQLVELDDGQVIDGATQQRLYHAVQRLVLLPAEFDGTSIKPAGLDLIEMAAEEAGMFSGVKTKLTIFVNYQESNEAVYRHTLGIDKLSPIQAYGKIGAEKNLKNVERFLTDPSVNVLIAHPGSIGIGLNLQSVCSTALFLELPLTSDIFQQALGRFYRQGQKRACLIKFAIAAGTIQVELGRRIVQKEADLQRIMPTKQTLRRALFGE